MIGMIRSLSFFEHQIGWVCFISVKRVGFLIQKKKLRQNDSNLWSLDFERSI